MENAIMLIATLNLIVSTAMCVVMLTLPKRENTPKQQKKTESSKALTEEEAAELLRMKQEAEKRERYWQNFLNYTGESQIKGGD